MMMTVYLVFKLSKIITSFTNFLIKKSFVRSPVDCVFFFVVLRRRKFGQNRVKAVLWESSKNQFSNIF